MLAIKSFALACVIVLSGIAFAAHPSGAQTPKEPMSAEVGEPVSVKLYFVRNDSLVVVHRVIPMPEGKRIARATVQLLLDGPTEQESAFGVASAIPFLTSLVDIELDPETAVATATLSGAFTGNVWGGNANLRYAQLVYTLTQFSTIAAARIDVEPQAAAEREANPDVVARLGTIYDRTALDGTLHGVFFDSVGVGDTISSPLRLTGYANVFEGQFTVHLRDLNGNEIASELLGAAWGEHYGAFDGELTFDPAASSSRLVILTVGAVTGYAGDRDMPDLVNLPLWLE